MTRATPPTYVWPLLSLISSLVWSDIFIWMLCCNELNEEATNLLDTGIVPPWGFRSAYERGTAAGYLGCAVLVIGAAWSTAIVTAASVVVFRYALVFVFACLSLATPNLFFH